MRGVFLRTARSPSARKEHPAGHHLHGEGRAEQPVPCHVRREHTGQRGGSDARTREIDAGIARRDRSDNIICLCGVHVTQATKIKAVWAPTPTSKLPALHTNSLRCLCSANSPARWERRVLCAVLRGRMGPDPSSRSGVTERLPLARR